MISAFTGAVAEEILKALSPDYIAVLTLLRGEPLEYYLKYLSNSG